MLNHAKVLRELERVSDRLFLNHSPEAHWARAVWAIIANDPTFQYKLRNVTVPWLVPSWTGKLDQAFVVQKYVSCYRALAIDGSQIYPDKHEGTTCSLINIGSVHLNYGVQDQKVVLDSVPTVFIGDEDISLNENPHELVDCYRQEFEFFAGIKHSEKIMKKNDAPSIFLFDGSLIFWHLEAKDPSVKMRFLSSYVDSLEKLYHNQILIAGYISLTKSKELVNLIRVALTELAQDLGLERFIEQTNGIIDHMSDAQVVRFFLKPFERTIVFKNHASITKHYPVHLHPHFFYLHVGREIVRIELPAWIAENVSMVEVVASLVVDQTIKGDGYPVALSEAHEQAVVKGPDRDFFYHMIRKIGLKQQVQGNISQKIRNKKGMRI